MYPILFRIGGLEITSFGVMVAVGALVGTWIFRNELRRSHLPESAVDAAVAGLVGGVVGAKLLWVAEHLGDEPLTTRELDVLRHVTEGSRNRDIAERLFISEETVKVHVKHIMEKLGASDRTHAMAIAARRGFIRL